MAPDRPSTSRPRVPRGFWVVWSTVAVDQIGFGIIIPVLPLYAEGFGASPAVIGLLAASFSLTQLVSARVGGRLSDRFGRRPVLLASLLGTCVGAAITAAAGAVWVLFVGRLVDGLSGVSQSSGQAAVTDMAEPGDRPRLLGLMGTAFGVGFVVGPVVGSLAALGGARLPFVAASVIAGVNAAVAWFRLPETRPEGERVSRHEQGEPLAAGVRRLALVGFVGSVAFAGFTATVALLLNRRLGLDEAGASAVFIVIGVVLIATQAGLVGWVNRILGEVGAIRFGLVSVGAGLVLLVPDRGWWTVAPGLAALAVGQATLTPSLSSAIAGLAGRRRGEALGVNQAAVGLGRVVGPAGAGVLFGQAVGLPYAVGAALAVLAVALVPRVAATGDRGHGGTRPVSGAGHPR